MRYKPLLLLLPLLLLCGCTKTAPPPDTTAIETQEVQKFDGFTIVRPDSASEGAVQVAIGLRDAFGDSLPLTTDWVDRDKTMPTDTPEILVGDTNRPETLQYRDGLRLDEFAVAYVNGRYVLVGGSDAALQAAADWFTTVALPYAGDTLYEGGNEYLHKCSYGAEAPTIAGQEINGYTILYTADRDREGECATLLQETIAARTGWWLPAKKISLTDVGKDKYARQILLVLDEGLDGYSVTVTDGKMRIAGADRVQLRAAILAMQNEMEDSTMQYENGTILEGKLVKQAITLYADATAAPGGDGSAAHPYATGDELYGGLVEKAKTGAYAITVELEPGDYPLSATMVLDSETIGTMDSSVRFVSQGEARFCGWVPVTGFTETTVNGVTAWAAPLPVVRGQVLYPNQCFSTAGERLLRPRYPAGDGELEAILDKPISEIVWNEPMTQFGYDDTAIEGFGRLDEIQIHMFHYWDDERLEIAELDTAKKVITTKTAPGIGFLEYTHGAPYYLDNVYEMLREPGQFYVDKVENRLLYIPREGEKLDGFTLQVSDIDVLLTVDGLHGSSEEPAVAFCNIGFVGSDWKTTNRASGQAASDIHGAVRLNDTSYVQFDGCTFAHIGDYALEVQKGVSHLDVTHCTFTDLGAGGVTIYGANNLTPDNNEVNHDLVITDNYIGSYGRIHANGIGIVLRYAYDCTLSHNEITDGYYSGISVGWSWGYADHATHDILVEKNHIYNIGQYMLSDMGGIYTLGVQPGTVLRGNLIHNVYSRTDKAWGLYTDEGSTDILIENNIAYDVKSEAFHQHYGKENIVRNNILALGRDGIVMVSRLEEHTAIHLERNILLSDGAPIYLQHPDGMNMADDSNLMWNLSGDVYCSGAKLSVADMQARGLFQNALVADPGFADPKNGDFTLPADSPAYDIGFVDIDMSDVGIREK